MVPPQLHDIEVSLWEAFCELSTERSSGMSTGPIPWSSIIRYHAYDNFLPLRTFLGIIRSIDSEYMSLINKDK